MGQVDASFQADTLQVSSYNVKFTSLYDTADTLAYSFLWDFGDGEQSNLPSLTHSYKNTGAYLVRFTVSDGINIDETNQIIRVHNLVEVPNVFTPNGDGRNDFLVIRTNGVDLYLLQIFSTTGSMVYKKTAYSFSWDGKTPDGVNTSSGVYFYTLTHNGKYIESGFFHLIR